MSGYKKLSGHVNHISIKLLSKKLRGDDTKTNQIFGVPIGNAKITKKVQLHPAAPLIQYHKNTYIISCLITLTSYYHCFGDNRAVTALVNNIE